jgi:hypothetical protein
VLNEFESRYAIFQSEAESNRRLVRTEDIDAG